MPYNFVRRDAQADDMVIAILNIGTFHLDLQFARNDLEIFHLPDGAPCHEIIGRVSNVGSGVTRLKPGDHVGTVVLLIHAGIAYYKRYYFKDDNLTYAF